MAATSLSGILLTGINFNDLIGIDVSFAGDVNGDGIDDVLIGSFSAVGGQVDAGKSFVVFGDASPSSALLDLSTLDGTNGFSISGFNSGDFAGRAVSDVGNVNDDGYADFAIGAFAADPGGLTDAGEAYIIYGGPGSFPSDIDLSTLDSTEGIRISGLNVGDKAGVSVANIGDLNNDGRSDFAIGSSGFNGSAGRLYVVYANPLGFGASIDLSTIDGLNGFVIDGINAGDELGSVLG